MHNCSKCRSRYIFFRFISPDHRGGIREQCQTKQLVVPRNILLSEIFFTLQIYNSWPMNIEVVLGSSVRRSSRWCRGRNGVSHAIPSPLPTKNLRMMIMMIIWGWWWWELVMMEKKNFVCVWQQKYTNSDEISLKWLDHIVGQGSYIADMTCK